MLRGIEKPARYFGNRIQKPPICKADLPADFSSCAGGFSMSDLGDEHLIREKARAWKHSRWVLHKRACLDRLSSSARAQLTKKAKPCSEYGRLKSATTEMGLAVAIRRLCSQ